MSELQVNKRIFPPIRACIFDVDGLLINSEDIYTEIYNNILHSYGKPSLPWSVKAKQQSRGRSVPYLLLPTHPIPFTQRPKLIAETRACSSSSTGPNCQLAMTNGPQKSAPNTRSSRTANPSPASPNSYPTSLEAIPTSPSPPPPRPKHSQ